MKKGRVLNLKNFDRLFSFFAENNFLIIFSLLFIFGLLSGILFYGKNEFLNKLTQNVFSLFLESRSDMVFLSVFLDSFFSSLLLLLVVFGFGTSLIGVITIPLSLFGFAFIYGSIISFLYSEYGLKGVAFHTVIILPSFIILIITLIISSIHSTRFSILLAKQTLPTAIPIDISFNFKKYLSRFVLYIFIILFSAIADALISSNFLNEFSL